MESRYQKRLSEILPQVTRRVREFITRLRRNFPLVLRRNVRQIQEAMMAAGESAPLKQVEDFAKQKLESDERANATGMGTGRRRRRPRARGVARRAARRTARRAVRRQARREQRKRMSGGKGQRKTG